METPISLRTLHLYDLCWALQLIFQPSHYHHRPGISKMHFAQPEGVFVSGGVKRGEIQMFCMFLWPESWLRISSMCRCISYITYWRWCGSPCYVCWWLDQAVIFLDLHKIRRQQWHIRWGVRYLSFFSLSSFLARSCCKNSERNSYGNIEDIILFDLETSSDKKQIQVHSHTHRNPCIGIYLPTSQFTIKINHSQGTIGCTPNSVPMVFSWCSLVRGSWGL